MDILEILKYILIVVASVIALIILITAVFVVVRLIKGERFKKREIKSKYKKRNVFVRLFYDFPKRKSADFFLKDPNAMTIHGVYVFAGEQGSGKTIAAIQFLREQTKLHPLIKVKSNIACN